MSDSTRPILAGALAAAATALALALALAPGASAKTFVVTKRADPVPDACKKRDCSLREAVLAANARPGKDVVELPNRRKPYNLFQPGTGEDDALTGDIDIANNPLVIRHPGKGRATVNANGVERAFEVLEGAPTTLKKLVVTGGVTDNDGGGIHADDDLRLRKSVVRGNVADDDGGGIDIDGETLLVVANSIVAGNRTTIATGDGGGINGAGTGSSAVIRSSRVVGNVGGGAGGGVEAASTMLTILDSTFARNAATDHGGGVHNDAAAAMTIRGSTFDRNRTGDDGGALFADGPPVNVVNSTFSANRADGTGGAIHARDGADVSLNAVTVARNVADADADGLVAISGGGLFRLSSMGFEVENSLIALNTLGAAGTLRNDCSGDAKIDTLGHNLVSTDGPGNACDGFGPPNGPGDIVNKNPRIGKLKRNGGPTRTIALRKRSPAINKAKRSTAPKRDQRGVKRKRKRDIGAYERNVKR